MGAALRLGLADGVRRRWNPEDVDANLGVALGVALGIDAPAPDGLLQAAVFGAVREWHAGEDAFDAVLDVARADDQADLLLRAAALREAPWSRRIMTYRAAAGCNAERAHGVMRSVVESASEDPLLRIALMRRAEELGLGGASAQSWRPGLTRVAEGDPDERVRAVAREALGRGPQ